MRKTKLTVSLLSLMMALVFLFGTLVSSFSRETATADIKIGGAKEKIQTIRDNIYGLLNKQSTQTTEPSQSDFQETLVYIGGYPVGLKLYADGVVVVGTEAVDTADGFVDCAKNAGLKVGDIIKTINNVNISSNKQASEIIEKSGGELLSFIVERQNELLNIEFKSMYSVSENRYKAGLWIRDSSAGIGTVSFVTQEGYFASLGHAVCDIDTKMTIPISQGTTANTVLTGYVKGECGKAGELNGYLENGETGEIYINDNIGVYGKFYNIRNKEYGLYPIAEKTDVKTGYAQIYTTIENGKLEVFDVEIKEIDSKNSENKHLVVEITDQTLLDKTGGIIQGMSGSPIIQNGKLIGAVTHVLVDNPACGYGIFAETMLETAKGVEQSKNLKDAG